jgi:methylated-DNA-protein-cysteine methyltransferase related protein
MKKSEFFNEVYNIVAQIPKGNVMTYGQLAVMLGSPYYARRVGQAMRNTPEYLDIPCHRVVNSNGGLAPIYAFGGEGQQYEMLLSEGVFFKKNNCVDLKKSIWRKAYMD